METKPLSENSYTELISELNAIVSEMQSDRCDIDKLTEKTRRAIALIAECRSRLTATDSELKNIMQNLEQ